MTAARTRQGMAAFASFLLVFAMVPAALGQSASQTQDVEVYVTKAGILSIGVDEHINFGNLLPGQLSGQHFFGTNYTNTLESEQAWSATVTATEFVRWDWVDNYPDDDSYEPTDDTFSYDTLTIFPGYDEWAHMEMGVQFGSQATFTGSGTVSDPVTLFNAPGTFRGGFGTGHEAHNGNQPAWLQIHVPTAVEHGQHDWRSHYTATLTYTITG